MRIGVNVPNELLERVKEIEPRVNISSICRKAIESTQLTQPKEPKPKLPMA